MVHRITVGLSRASCTFHELRESRRVYKIPPSWTPPRLFILARSRERHNFSIIPSLEVEFLIQRRAM